MNEAISKNGMNIAAHIKDSLVHTWQPFFSRFGKFTTIQKITIPKILQGKNVVVISAAASGKTEAVIAPLIENLLHNGVKTMHELKILYVSPTRALVNDLYRRLSEPINYVGLELGRKTGDHPQLNPKKLPHILITTPESFDSLLSRQTKILQSVENIVLDEIHLLDNTPRGDQLRVLLERLRLITNTMQYSALSATIDDKAIGERYFDDAEVCFVESEREIEFQLVPNKDVVARIFSLARSHGLKKLLIFFNARSLVEMFSQELNQPPFHGKIFVHHASLQKQRREETERLMNQSEAGILCATSTLELGIDIGDIDCVVLYRPPFNISSLLQRMGRGNRRTNRLFALGIYTNKWEKILFNKFFDCARKGRLYEKRYQPSLSVIPQQIFSYLYQRRRIGTTVLSMSKILSHVFTNEQIKATFRQLVRDAKIVEQRPGIYFDSPKIEKKIRWGKIHSNIAEVGFGEYDVFSAETGTMVGRIFHLKSRFILGGRCWEIVRIEERLKKVYARYIGDSPIIAKVFEGKGEGNYSFRFAAILKQEFFPELGSMEFAMTHDKKNIYIFHIFGSLYGSILADSLYEQNIDCFDVDGKMLILNNCEFEPGVFPIPSSEAIRSVINRNIAKLEDALGSGAYFYDLPRAMQVQDHYQNLDIDGFLDFLSSVKTVYYEYKTFQENIKKMD